MPFHTSIKMNSKFSISNGITSVGGERVASKAFVKIWRIMYRLSPALLLVSPGSLYCLWHGRDSLHNFLQQWSFLCFGRWLVKVTRTRIKWKRLSKGPIYKFLRLSDYSVINKALRCERKDFPTLSQQEGKFSCFLCRTNGFRFSGVYSSNPSMYEWASERAGKKKEGEIWTDEMSVALCMNIFSTLIFQSIFPDARSTQNLEATFKKSSFPLERAKENDKLDWRSGKPFCWWHFISSLSNYHLEWGDACSVESVVSRQCRKSASRRKKPAKS